MIRWINENIGTGPFTKVPASDDYSILDVRDLVDKGGNTAAAIRSRIADGLNILKTGKKLVVCCDHGISRSNAVATGILARHKNIPFSDAIRTTIASTGEKSIKVEMLNIVRYALGEELPSFGDGKRVLVTGGNTLNLDGQKTDLDPAVDVAEFDCLVKDNGINVIVHLANPLTKMTNPAAGQTITMLRNMLDICRDNGVHFIYPSTIEVYGSQNDNPDENAVCNPKGIYGETKYMVEQLIALYAKNFDVKSTVLRLGTPYGDGENPKFLYNFLKKVVAGQDIVTHQYKNGFPLLDLIHVGDIQSAIDAVIENDVTGTFNIGSEKGVLTNEIANQIVKRMDVKVGVSHIDIDDNAPNTVMNCTKAQDTFGWKAQKCFKDWLNDAIDSTDKTKG